MSVLGKEQIKQRMEKRSYAGKLLVTPLLNENQIGPASIDIRLGSSIIVPRRTFTSKHDVTDPGAARLVEKRLYDRVRLKPRAEFILHPDQLILAVTFEYLSLPLDLCCQVASRSSWGRLGLIVATASMVQPGFRGCLTLELVNVSESPIALYPGLLVGQLIFFDVDRAGEGRMAEAYHGRYDCPTEAELPRFFSKKIDAEMTHWGPPRNADGTPQTT